jgi:hypothetical protein
LKLNSRLTNAAREIINFSAIHFRFNSAIENEPAFGSALRKGATPSEISMKKMLAAVLASVTLGVTSLGPTASARADDAGAAVAAGIGGFALGAMTGGAMARAAPPVYYGAPQPVYVEPPHCWRESRPVFDEYGDVIGYRPRRVCE